MCGRLSVLRDPVGKAVRNTFGIAFRTDTNLDLRPTQSVATILRSHSELQQTNLLWGIQPFWAKNLIINAKAETVSVKATFIEGFEHSRVLVPCSGWYEWNEVDGRKQKFAFRQNDSGVFYIAGLALENASKLVILTTEANQQCQPYHDRMPLLIERDCVMTWLTGSVELVFPLLINQFSEPLTIEADPEY